MTDRLEIVRRHVLMLIPELGFGGAEKSFLRLARLLSKHHEVSLAVFKRHYATGNYSKDEGEIGLPLTVLDVDEASGRFGRWLNRWHKLRVLKKNAEVTISFLTGANILNVVSGGRGRKIVSMRGSRRYDPALTDSKRLLYEHFIDPLTFKYSDRVISISEGLSDELKKNVGQVTREKIKTIELFFDAEHMIAGSSAAIEDEIYNLKGLPIIVSAGRLSPEKGFQHLIQVFAMVRHSIPEAKLLLIGDGPSYQALIEQCQSLSLPVCYGKSEISESAVIFTGYRNNPHRYFRVARLFVSSSLTEGFSNTIVEALAAKIPVLATDCPWGPRSILWKTPVDVTTPYPTEVPTYADYGLLMPRIDQDRFHVVWADELVKLLSKPSLAEDYTERGLERVCELDARRIVHKWLDVVGELCGEIR